jgi:uncharacterized peroxidase-related enzyme
MRLPSLSRSWRLGDRLKLKAVRVVSSRPPADIVQLMHYRRDYFGDPFATWVDRVLRGPSEWSVGERELMAAFVSRLNQCRFCADSHGAQAEVALGIDVTEAVDADWRTAPLRPALRATFELLEVLTLRPADMRPEQVESAYAVGVSEQGVRDVIHICAIFSIINRVADAVDFAELDADAYRQNAGYLLKRGYQLR